MKRLAAMIVTLFLGASTLALAGLPTAGASATSAPSESRAVTISARAGDCLAPVAQPGTRQVNMCAAIRRGRGIITGRIFPKYRNKVAILQRAACATGCKFRTVQRDRTTRRGAYRFVVGKTGTYRVKALRGQGFRASYSDGAFTFS